jgi:predicted enzyme related to lactoylglutathione lyase
MRIDTEVRADRIVPMDFIANIDVDDLEKATRFYQAAFGLKVGRRFGGRGVEMLGCPVAIDFVVEDIESAAQIALAAGARLGAAVFTDRWGKLVLLADPFGHGFCFVQFLGHGYEEIADRGFQRLAMISVVSQRSDCRRCVCEIHL